MKSVSHIKLPILHYAGLGFGLYIAALIFREQYIVVAAFLFLMIITPFLIKDPVRNLILLIIGSFPLLPFHAGFDPGSPLPVFKVHRAAIATIFMLWVFDRGPKNCLFSLKDYPLWPVTGYVFMGLLSISFINGMNPVTINYVISFLVEECLLAFMVFDYFQDEKQQRGLLNVLCISGLVFAVLGIIEFVIRFNWYSVIPVYREEMTFAQKQMVRFDMNRIRGAFTHPINYGATLAVISACFMTFILTARTGVAKNLYVVSIGIMFVSCYLCLSRGPLLMFFMIILFIILWKRKQWLIYVFLFLTVLYYQPLIFTDITGQIHKLVSETVNLGQTKLGISAYARIQQFHRLLYHIKQKPFLGHGFSYLDSRFSHSIDIFYLRYCLNFGFIGLGIFLALIFTISKKTIAVATRGISEFQRNFGISYLAVICGVCLLWLTVAIDDYLLWFWIMAGITMRMKVSIRN